MVIGYRYKHEYQQFHFDFPNTKCPGLDNLGSPFMPLPFQETPMFSTITLKQPWGSSRAVPKRAPAACKTFRMKSIRVAILIHTDQMAAWGPLGLFWIGTED